MCQEDGNCVSATFIEPLWQVKSIKKNEMHPAVVQSSKKLRNENFLQIRYEDFVTDKIGTYSKILEFCEIEFHPSHKKYLLSKTIKDMNYKWKNDLSPSQQQILNSVLEQFLLKFDYVI